jgi:hypothetical protein
VQSNSYHSYYDKKKERKIQRYIAVDEDEDDDVHTFLIKAPFFYFRTDLTAVGRVAQDPSKT